MIIEVEDRFCKAAKVFSYLLNKLQRSAERGEALHEVEEMSWNGLIATGREMILAYIQEQEEDLPRPEVIEHEGKELHRLPERRTRPYVSAFGPTPFTRDVYAVRETQRQEVVPLDAKLGMPESDTSYLLQKWSGAQFVKESYKESQVTLQSILGFAPSVNSLEDMAAQAAEHAAAYLEQQRPVDPTTEGEILVATSDCKGVPMRKIERPEDEKTRRVAARETAEARGEKRPEADGVRRWGLLGGSLPSHGRGGARRDPPQGKAGRAAQAAKQASAGRADAGD